MNPKLWKMAEVDNDIFQEICRQLEHIFTGDVPEDFAVFASNTRSHSKTGLYFSPPAATYFAVQLSAIDAMACDAPHKPSVTLLGGHPDALRLLAEA